MPADYDATLACCRAAALRAMLTAGGSLAPIVAATAPLGDAQADAELLRRSGFSPAAVAVILRTLGHLRPVAARPLGGRAQ